MTATTRLGHAVLATLLSLGALAAPATAATGWAPPFALAPGAGNAVMTPDGTTVYSGAAEIDGARRAFVQVRPPGGTPGPVQVLSEMPADFPWSPTIATGPGGHVAATWIEDARLRVAVLQPGATEFAVVRSMPGKASGYNAADVDSTGTVHVLWTGDGISPKTGQRTVYVVAGTVPPGGAPTATATLASRAPSSNSTVQFSFLSIAVSDAGAAIAGWLEQSSVYSEYTTSTSMSVSAALRPSGGAFGTPIALDSASQSGDFPSGEWVVPGSVVMNSTGAAAAAWHRTNNNYTEEIRVRVGDTTALGTVQNPAAGGGLQPGSPRTGIDDAGRVHVAWIAEVAGVRRAQRSVRAGTTFGTPQTITTTGDAAETVALAVAPGGRAVLGLVTGSESAKRCTVLGTHADPGESFAAPTALRTTSSQDCAYVSAAVRSEGDGVLSWGRGGTTEAIYEAAGFDATAPQLRDVQIPGAATAGTPAAFSASASDLWGPLRYDWQFGDGTATGESVSHTFGGAGERAVTVTVTDAAGNSATAAGTVAVSAAPVVPETPPQDTTGSAVADLVAPAISKLGLSNRAFAVAPRATALVAARKVRRKRGTTFRFQLSEAGRVAVTIHRVVRQRKRTRFVRTGKLTRTGVVGRNRVAFSGRLGKRALRPGRYRATLRATDAAGNASRTASVRFRVVR